MSSISLMNIDTKSVCPDEIYLVSNVEKTKYDTEYSSNSNLSKSNLDEESAIESKDILVKQYKRDIISVIRDDYFEDGIVTKSEEYIRRNYDESTTQYIKPALMELYVENLSNSHVLSGLLMMIGSIPYENIAPEGQIMAMGLLQNKDISIRDKAVQVFERWNSKKGIDVLRSLDCDRKWLQRYVDKVIMYIEKDGID